MSECPDSEHWWMPVYRSTPPKDARQQLAETGQITIEIGPVAKCVWCGKLAYPPGMPKLDASW